MDNHSISIRDLGHINECTTVQSLYLKLRYLISQGYSHNRIMIIDEGLKDNVIPDIHTLEYGNKDNIVYIKGDSNG